ncbi:hypothetical protein [Arcanobacterium buesumense]|uniref:Uncharacterized protein n=1 Tax=Arcanobacterium buesumense TaxID=2722751 RepID=A0A6H2ELI6_9ACTO|nr:hypothetical protein [Arcanobacterium buesumense]QJC21934.1 hypothetical protein HC352_05070 [Arcanobacterium buesumense]
MSNTDVLFEHQRKWADEYRRALADHNVSPDTAQAEADRQLELLQQLNLDPLNSDDWIAIDEAVSQYLAKHPFQKALQTQEVTVWNTLSYVGTLITGFSVWIPISEWIQGDFSWQISLSANTLIFLTYVSLIAATFVVFRITYYRHGLLRSLLAATPVLALVVLVLFLPLHIWDKQTLDSSYGTMPTLLATALGVTLGIAVNVLSKKHDARRAHKRALRMWELHQGDHTNELNCIWLSELEGILRTSYQYNSALINSTLPELGYHLSAKSTSSEPVLAEEEFGAARQFAYQLASNNHRAVIHAKRNEMLGQLVFLALSLLALFSWAMAKISGENSATLWLILLFGIGGTVLSSISAISCWHDWRAARTQRRLS